MLVSQTHKLTILALLVRIGLVPVDRAKLRAIRFAILIGKSPLDTDSWAALLRASL